MIVRWSLYVWHPILTRAHLRSLNSSMKKCAAMHSRVEANKHQLDIYIYIYNIYIYTVCLSSPNKFANFFFGCSCGLPPQKYDHRPGIISVAWDFCSIDKWMCDFIFQTEGDTTVVKAFRRDSSSWPEDTRLGETRRWWFLLWKHPIGP